MKKRILKQKILYTFLALLAASMTLLVYSYTNSAGVSANDSYVSLQIGANPSVTAPSGTTITTTTNNQALYNVSGNKSFYAAGRYWVFWQEGTAIKYSSSTDGTTWYATQTYYATLTIYDPTAPFSLFYNATTGYVSLAYCGRDYGNYTDQVYYREFTPSSDGHTLTFRAAESNVDQDVEDDYWQPVVTVDSSGYPRVAFLTYTNYNSSDWYVVLSTTNNGTFTNTWANSLEFHPCYQIALVSLTSQKIGVLYYRAVGSAGVYYKEWSGSSWGTEVGVYPYATGDTYNSMCIVAYGDNLHAAWTNYTGGLIDEYDRISGTWSHGWNDSSENASVDQYASLAVDPTTGNTYAFCTENASPVLNHVVYRKFTASTATWDASHTDWLDESTDTFGTYPCIESFYGSSSIGVVYETKSATPWNLKFAVLSLGGGATADFTNTGGNISLGTLNPSSTYYAKGSAPSNPVATTDCTWYITNTGSAAEDYKMSMTNFTGGVGWTLASSVGSNQVVVTAYYSGENPASGLVLTTFAQTFYTNLAASATKWWDFRLDSPSVMTDGVSKVSVLTITASLH